LGFVYHHKRGLIAGRGEKSRSVPTVTDVQRLGDPQELLKHFKPGDWNLYRVVCRGPEIELYVNGALMCRFTDNTAEGAAEQGVIALQMHPGPPMKVQFRKHRFERVAERGVTSCETT
jgi:hypothetical protein